ncbi:MAG: polysaccharide pyruvyl transferase family protein [Kiritimatiellales bacterium]|nr:polysaccharide pyruvyl transferase family protein [Kiritimatiellales bacterium]
MKLYYCDIPNFGDALNVWLWPRLLPGAFDDASESPLFVGIGTLLDKAVLPKKRKKIVFSAGAGYGRRPRHIDDTYTIYCVRGPLTAKSLGLSPEKAITDGAVLCTQFYRPPSDEKRHQVSFVPHWSTLRNWDWPAMCRDIGFHYIDPGCGVEPFLDQVAASELVVAEAMHGAIAADLLRVPWIPLKSYPRTLAFKWRDWCQSLELEYNPCRLPCLYSGKRVSDKMIDMVPGTVTRRALKRAGIERVARGLVETVVRKANRTRSARVAQALRAIPHHHPRYLSDAAVLEDREQRLLQQLDRLRRDTTTRE